ncbi:MAG: protein-L-isoaspartate(D-aspartate) O-methyltransferase [Candidatus Hydrogenedentes bacterium]|nr:protein-L-isoaspartate(D-aspartate) O-methyltransferase [Candidatus Hydrogenedentota bacterium]
MNRSTQFARFTTRATSFFTALAASLLACTPTHAQSTEDRAAQRAAMVRTQIMTGIFGRTPVTHKAVLDAMRAVPRHEFVPPAHRDAAYQDTPLPIGYDQTISQPYVVAAMTAFIDPQPGDVVLEIGTGSGYQAAVLAEIVKTVYTIEIVPELGKAAEATLKHLKYDNVHVRIGDGYRGWPEQAPFDKIIVTAAPDHLPQSLLDQLKPGGSMIIPVGPEHAVQDLTLVTKLEDGTIKTETKDLVRFVPFTGEAQERN